MNVKKKLTLNSSSHKGDKTGLVNASATEGHTSQGPGPHSIGFLNSRSTILGAGTVIFVEYIITG